MSDRPETPTPAEPQSAPAVEPRIVASTFAASAALEPGGRARAQAIEAAMSGAIAACAEKGIVDPVEIRAAMMEARAAVKELWRREALRRQAMAQKRRPPAD
jgi:hypothetical protein